MLENPECIPNCGSQAQAKEKPIEKVVDVLIKNQTKQKRDLKDQKTYDLLFKDIKEVLSQFDTSIGDCKRYNEAKIHRKYEIRIGDLEDEVKKLKEKLKQQQNARSPSKKYIQQLVDQLVLFKTQNEKLKNQVFQLKKLKIESELNQHTERPQQSQRSNQISQEIKATSINYSARAVECEQANQFQIKKQIIQFLRNQRDARRINQQTRSKFQSFLKKRIDQLALCTFSQFLREVNKWSYELDKTAEDSLSSRLRSNVLSTLQDELEKSHKLPKINYLYAKIDQYQAYQSQPSDVRKMLRQKERAKSRKNYSTIEVVSRVGEKYTLK